MKMQFGRADIFIIRTAAALVAIVLCLAGCAYGGTGDATADVTQPPADGGSHETLLRVAYVPLDNRPINKERVQYLAQAASIELIMPDEELYRTALDNMAPNEDGSTIGDRRRIREWLLLADAECDHFIISLDQMTSGGLVGSRWLCNEDLTLEYGIIDTILTLCESNTVYLFDTVMRLASTVGYQGYGYEEYAVLRSYGEQERRVLSANELTVDKIIEAYPYGRDGEIIGCDIPTEKLSRYHASRARKLRITDYALRRLGDAADFIYIGVDDSSPKNTIQTNEINYINSLRGENSVLGAATDEAAMCCLARMVSELYGAEVSVDVTYFGNGQNEPADSFDIGTLDESMRSHLDAIGAVSANGGAGSLNVLCLTRASKDAEREELLLRIKQNQANRIPTVLIDVSEAPEELAEMMIKDRDIDICRLLGYSSWNTASNAIGIALSQGISRYGYLLSVDSSSQYATDGFLRSVTFSYIKDISYKCFHADLDGFMNDNHPCSASEILGRINGGCVIVSLSAPFAEPHAEISISNPRHPWSRSFEMTFDIETE